MNRLYDYYNEAEIQFELAKRLEKDGFEAYLERNFELKNFSRTKRKKRVTKIRVDVVVAYLGKIICVIEVKNNLTSDSNPKNRQLAKYKNLGYPFFFCWNYNYIDKTIDWVRKIKRENN